jgi:hypothetical protein
VDEAIAVAKELGEREQNMLSGEEDLTIEEEIGIDLAEMEHSSSMESSERN